jgi:hypothetical protein
LRGGARCTILATMTTAPEGTLAPPSDIQWYPSPCGNTYTSNKGVAVYYSDDTSGPRTYITYNNDAVSVRGKLTFAECRVYFAALGVSLD